MAFNIPFLNNTGDTIPGYAVMQCNGTANVAGKAVMTVCQPNELFCRLYYLNGPVSIPDGEYGNCTDALGGPYGDDLNFALFNPYSDNSYDYPAYGQQWGPVPGEWYLERGRYGFTVVGPYIQDGTVGDQTVLIDGTPDVTFTVVDSEAPADGAPADIMNRVVVQQERVSIVKGVTDSALRNEPDATGGDLTTTVAQVSVIFCKELLNANPVTHAENDTGQDLHNVRPWCLQGGDNIAVDFVVCAYMNGQWYVIQTLTCPPAIS